MTYFERVDKDKLREYQRKASRIRGIKHSMNCRIAVRMYDEGESIHAIADKFGVKRDAAYKMIKKGRQNV